jgi:MFS family permease
VIGFAMICFFSTSQSVVQLETGDRLRGRVLGIWSMMISLGLPLGSLAAGVVADLHTEATALTWQGVLCGSLALGLCGLWLWFGPGRPGMKPSP